MVETSSPILVAMVSTPTGPPLNFLMRAFKYSKSIASSPYASTFNRFKASNVVSSSMVSKSFTSAKSRTRLNNLLAIRGVLRQRLLMFLAAASVISIARTRLVRLIMEKSYSSV